jgi:hypothetical protein
MYIQLHELLLNPRMTAPQWTGLSTLRWAGPTWSQAEVDAAKAAGVGARAEFDETLVALQTGLTDLDPLEVLARTALSLTFRVATMQFEPDKKGVEVYHVEILQALALSSERRIDADGDFPATTQASIDLIDRNGQGK